MFRRLTTAIVSLVLTAATLAAQQPQPPTPGQDGFVPASSLPPGQEIPAGPLFIGAYAVFLVLMMFYLWTIWRRINKVEREMQDLDRRMQRGGAR